MPTLDPRSTAGRGKGPEFGVPSGTGRFRSKGDMVKGHAGGQAEVVVAVGAHNTTPGPPPAWCLHASCASRDPETLWMSFAEVSGTF